VIDSFLLEGPSWGVEGGGVYIESEVQFL
jgi:hypothetical protein